MITTTDENFYIGVMLINVHWLNTTIMPMLTALF